MIVRISLTTSSQAVHRAWNAVLAGLLLVLSVLLVAHVIHLSQGPRARGAGASSVAMLDPALSHLASPPGPPVTADRRVVLVTPVHPAPNNAEARERRWALARLSRMLDRLGIPYASLPDTELSLAALRPYAVAILPGNVLTQGNTQSLEAYVAAGGRILALFPRGPDALYTLFGVSCEGVRGPASPRQFRTLLFREPDQVLGLPEQMEQNSPHALILTPAEGTRTLGWWHSRGETTLPAATLNKAGMLVGHLLTADDPHRKRAFLLAALAHLDSSLWGQAASTRRAAAASRLEAQRARWKRLSSHPGLAGRGPAVERYVAEARAALAGVAQRPPSDAHHGRAAYQKVEAAERALDCLESALTPAPAGELRGFWIHTYQPTDWDSVMAKAKAGGLNAAFVRVGRGGNTLYPNPLLPLDPWAKEAGGDELQRAIDAARKHGLAFHAWRVVYHLGSAPREYQERMAAEDRLVRDPEGTQHNWANPGDPRNQELEYQVALDLIKRYDVDGYHLDYIRYPEVPHTRFDYGEVSRREFERASGVRVKRWPQDVRTGSMRERYEEWQRENISRLVKRIYTGIKEVKPKVQVSAAVWRNYPSCRDGVRQEWPRWVRAGWLDFVVPMNYVLDAGEQEQMVRAHIREVGGARPVIAGIGSWQLHSPGEVLAHVRAARAGGAKGFVLFSFNDEAIGDHLQVLSAGACSP